MLIEKTPLISSVSHFNFEVGALFGGLLPQKPPVATGLNFGPTVSLDRKLANICLIRIIPYSASWAL